MKISIYCMVAALFISALPGCANGLLPTAVDFGDSTSKAYAAYARAYLYGQVDLRHDPWDQGNIVPANGWQYIDKEIVYAINNGYSATLLESMEQRLTQGTWFNVIAFNSGYHDLQHSPLLPVGSTRISQSAYRNNLEAIAQVCEQHAGVCIWVDTPGLGTDQLSVGSAVVDNVNIPIYNAIAREVAREHGFYMLDMPDTGHNGTVHFTKYGYMALGKRLADCVFIALNEQATATCHK